MINKRSIFLMIIIAFLFITGCEKKDININQDTEEKTDILNSNQEANKPNEEKTDILNSNQEANKPNEEKNQDLSENDKELNSNNVLNSNDDSQNVSNNGSTSGGKTDTTPPKIKFVKVDKNSYKVGETIIVTADVEDESVVEYIRITFNMPNGQVGDAWCDAKKNSSGKYTCGIKVKENFLSGEYVFSEAAAWDSCNNYGHNEYGEFLDVKFTVD